MDIMNTEQQIFFKKIKHVFGELAQQYTAFAEGLSSVPRIRK